MRDLSRAKSADRPDADGTKLEDDRQLTELLLQNRVNVAPATVGPVKATAASPFFSRIRTGLVVFVALPLALIAYFSSRTEEDDFYA